MGDLMDVVLAVVIMLVMVLALCAVFYYAPETPAQQEPTPREYSFWVEPDRHGMTTVSGACTNPYGTWLANNSVTVVVIDTQYVTGFLTYGSLTYADYVGSGITDTFSTNSNSNVDVFVTENNVTLSGYTNFHAWVWAVWGC